MKAWVLWHMYGDGSSASVLRVYLNEFRAQEDYQLLTEPPAGSTEWHLDKVEIFGDKE